MTQDEMGRLPVPTENIVTPKYSEDISFIMGDMDGKTVVGFHSSEQTFVIPLPMFHALMEFYVDQVTPNEAEGEKYQ